MRARKRDAWLRVEDEGRGAGLHLVDMQLQRHVLLLAPVGRRNRADSVVDLACLKARAHGHAAQPRREDHDQAGVARPALRHMVDAYAHARTTLQWPTVGIRRYARRHAALATPSLRSRALSLLQGVPSRSD